MATNAAFISAMQGITVSGVTKHYDQPPASVNTADMPVAYPEIPAGERGEPFSSCTALDKARTMRYVILVKPVSLSTPAISYGKLGTLMDALETKLDALEISAGGSLSNFISYTIAAGAGFPLGDVLYWAIVADVTARETP